jgi:hypothetical protein
MVLFAHWACNEQFSGVHSTSCALNCIQLQRSRHDKYLLLQAAKQLSSHPHKSSFRFLRFAVDEDFEPANHFTTNEHNNTSSQQAYFTCATLVLSRQPTHQIHTAVIDFGRRWQHRCTRVQITRENSRRNCVRNQLQQLPTKPVYSGVAALSLAMIELQSLSTTSAVDWPLSCTSSGDAVRIASTKNDDWLDACPSARNSAMKLQLQQLPRHLRMLALWQCHWQ